MKVHSLQFKFLATVMAAILTIAVFIGAVSIFEVNSYIHDQTDNLVKTTCSNEASQINAILGDIEKSVSIMESYVLSCFKTKDEVFDSAKQQQVTEMAKKMFVDVAKNTDGSVAYYLRYNPDIADPKSGLFYSKTVDSDEYIYFEPTDLSLYDKNDIEHVGWFWIPHEMGKPVWISPYYNRNNDILMISYTVPLYYDHVFVGVVGMDIDYTVLANRVHNAGIYKNGFACLELNGEVIEHDTEHRDASPDDYMIVSQELVNGMTFLLYADYEDIHQIERNIVFRILISSILILLGFALIVFFMVQKITRPLKTLTEASVKLATGDFTVVDVPHSNTYEIDMLGSAFENMTETLIEHRKLQSFLAYRDPLTKLRNTTAYKSLETSLNKRIVEDTVSFGLIMFDLNLLKEANDAHGHIMGDKLIATAAHVISDTFKRSPVFRIGGDEFLVVLQGKDLEEHIELLEKFDTDCANTLVELEDDVKLPLSVAHGHSIFNPDTDTLVSDVFKRADTAMYSNKRTAKSRKR